MDIGAEGSFGFQSTRRLSGKSNNTGKSFFPSVNNVERVPDTPADNFSVY